MVSQTNGPGASAPALVSLESMLSASLTEMRQLAAEAGTDEWLDAWSKTVLDRRPHILVAAVFPHQTLTWVMRPEPDDDGVLTACVIRTVDETGQPINLARAEGGFKG